MSLRHALLGVLAIREMTGYDIKRQFDRSLHFYWNASDSQIYRELRRLEETGMVRSHWIEQSDKPNKRVYSITPEGERELDDWIRADISWEEVHDKDPFLLKMFFIGRLEPEEIRGILEDRLRQLSKAIEFYDRRMVEFANIERSRNPELLRWQLMLLEGVREIDTAESNWIMRLIRTLDRELAAQRGSAPGRPDPPVDRGPDPAA